MKPDEFKIVLEDINEKFETLIEGHKLLNENLHRHDEENRLEHKQLRDDVLSLSKDAFDLKKDLTDHRENTELHAVKKRKKVS